MSQLPLRYQFDRPPSLVGTRGSERKLDRTCTSWDTRISRWGSTSPNPQDVYVSEKAHFVLRNALRWTSKPMSRHPIFLDVLDGCIDLLIQTQDEPDNNLDQGMPLEILNRNIAKFISPWACTNTQTRQIVCNFTCERQKEPKPDSWPLTNDDLGPSLEDAQRPANPAEFGPDVSLIMPRNINSFIKSGTKAEIIFTLSGWVSNKDESKYFSLHPIFAQAEADEMQRELNIAARKFADDNAVTLSTVAQSEAFWDMFGQDMCNFHAEHACVAGVIRRVHRDRQNYGLSADGSFATFEPSSLYFDPLEAGPEQVRVDSKWIDSKETFPGTVKLQFTPPLSRGAAN